MLRDGRHAPARLSHTRSRRLTFGSLVQWPARGVSRRDLGGREVPCLGFKFKQYTPQPSSVLVFWPKAQLIIK